MATVTQALQSNMPRELWGGLPVTPACVKKDNFVLAGADASFTVPTGASWVVITVASESTTDLWWNIGAAASKPAASTTNQAGMGCVVVGATRGLAVRAGDVWHLFGTCLGTLEWYSQGNPAL